MRLNLKIIGDEILPLKVNAEETIIPLHVRNVEVVHTGIPPAYTGPYDVTPASYLDQTLETKDKLMGDNVRVQKIPSFLVSNPQGGNTFIVGEEYYA